MGAVAALIAFVAQLPASSQPASAAVGSVSGSAYGYFANVSLFGGPPNPRGPAPTVDLPPEGSAAPITASSPTGSVVYGPAMVFTSGPIIVSTQGTTGAGGSVTSSATIQNVNTSQSEVFTADALSSTCTASESGVGGSTTVTNGTIILQDPDPDTSGEPGEDIEQIPTNPAPNTTYTGTVANVGDNFRAVFNEQIVNPDGSLTVYAYHLQLLGPTAIGDVFVGKAQCGVSSGAPTTTSTSTSTSSTSTSTSTSTTSSTTSTSTSTTSSTTPSTSTSTTLPGSPTCGGLPATIVGTDNPDVLIGTPGDDVIVGLGGDDRIDGQGGNDTICGGDGDDSIVGGPGDDSIFGEAGNDRIDGSDGADFIDGGEGNDLVSGGLGDDAINGGPGNNALSGDAGDDFFFHDEDSTGTNVFVGGPGNDFVEAFANPLKAGDRYDGGDGHDVLAGHLDGGVFVGGADDDALTLLDSGTFYGGPGNDEVGGMSGGTFYGGDGNDFVSYMTGGTFYGEGGDEQIGEIKGTAVALGGEGNEIVSHVFEQGLFCGGSGDDSVVILSTFNNPDGSPDAAQGGTFYGEEGNDIVGLFLPGGTFIQDGTCPVPYVPPPVSP